VAVNVGRRIARGLVIAGLVSLCVACGSSGGSSGGSGDCGAPFSTNLGGTWLVQETSTGETGGCATTQRTFQTGCVQTVTGESLTFIGATTWTATLCGSRASANGIFSVPDGSGFRQYRNLVLQFSSETAFTGTASWTFTSTSGSTCTGSSTFQGTK
jgi:hypothetical protein